MYGPAWNTGTCLYMIWAGLGCLMQCINSIVWNGNMVNRAPIYCDICESVDPLSTQRLLTLHHPIATRIQVALNVAIPACSLCINRRVCKIATAKVAMTTHSERRRAVIQDLLIGVGLPILQIIARECAYPFTVSELFSRMQSRIRCFVESL
jgi:pheromone a factor receptor